MSTLQELERWRPFAPGACKNRANTLMAELPKAGQRELQQWLLEPLPPLQKGWVWFPVTRRGWPGGHLVAVRVCPLRPARPVEERRVANARAWLKSMEIDLPAKTLAWEQLPEGVEVEGESCALAIALALLLDALGHQPEHPLLVSAKTTFREQQAWLGGVAEGEHKRHIAEQEAPHVPFFLMEGDGEAALPYLQAFLPKDWRQRLSPSSAYTLASRAWQAYQDRRYQEAARLAELVIQERPEERTRARALWVRGACAMHNARSEDAADDLYQSRLIFQGHTSEDDYPFDWEEEELLSFELIAALDLGRPEWLRQRLEDALACMQAAVTHNSRWREVALQVAGSLHRVELLADRLDQAEHLLREISLKTACIRHEKARSLGDLAEVLRRKNQLEEARHTIKQARAALPDTREGQRAATARFLSLYAQRCGADEPQEEYAETIPAPRWQDWPHPAEVLEHLLRRPGAELGKWIREHVLEKHQEIIHLLVVLGSGARHAAPPPELRQVGAELKNRVSEPGLLKLAEQAADGDFSGWRRCGPY